MDYAEYVKKVLAAKTLRAGYEVQASGQWNIAENWYSGIAILTYIAMLLLSNMAVSSNKTALIVVSVAFGVSLIGWIISWYMKWTKKEQASLLFEREHPAEAELLRKHSELQKI